ncbi:MULTISPECIES: AlbA family DNA-binding domain-containing protein [Acidithiobacillus]|jgi:Divergent AAA domain.|nr:MULTISPECIES: ATP-binding protein [Acidithiobacillus]MBU2720724.1 ATP-binding protein [Acidithiobacillus ferridurans]MDA8152845.1 ATP-binding protein [Acidithiobacillus sp.]ACH84262.1 putative transcriptional regulator [Acidithiobacillus ferrooxidans ATCC 53993]MBN6744643.1 ATP-binding protein [Acidithiobacillus sp. MC2.2]MBN6747196.1 ATP-binding protein [Acidithiobacillus sp. PG05]
MALTKKQHEAFAKFFESPTRSALRDLLKGNIGETDYLDFKETWPEPVKLAKHILAMANSGGGAIVVGVKQSEDNAVEAIGLEKLEDKSDISKKIASYLPSEIALEILDFTYTESEYEKIRGKSFQVMLVEYNPKIVPLLPKKEGDGIRRNAVYIRKGTNTEEANYEDLQELINKRLETGYSTQKSFELYKHLDQLKVLDINQPRNKSRKGRFFGDMRTLGDIFGPHNSLEYDKFLEGLYEKKKKIIEREIGL